MNCIITTLTVLSVFNGSHWNDLSVSTVSKFTNMNEQASVKAEFLSENVLKTETVTVKCGDDIYSTATATLTKETID